MIKYERIILYLSIIVLLYMTLRGCDRVNTINGLHNATTDTLTQTRNRLNQQVTSIAEFTSEREKDFLRLSTQDSSIKSLQSLVKTYRGKLQAATIASTETTDSGKNETIITIDTVYLSDGKPVAHPVYSTSWNTRWSEGCIDARHDFIYHDIKIKNEYTFTHGFKRNLFKKDVLKVEMTNLNPNTVTTELRSYSVVIPKKRFSIGLGVSYGYSLTTWKRDAVVGVNCSFSLVRF